MPHRTGRLPRKRDGVIHMTGDWNGQIGLHGLAWGIPQERIPGFKNQSADAKTLYAEIKSAGRNSVGTGQCPVSFRELETAMEFLKADCFNPLPRTPDELAAPLLAVRGRSSTSILPSTVAPGLSLHGAGGQGIPVKLLMDAIPPDKRGAYHSFGKRGLKSAGRWAAAEEAAADPRLLAHPPARFSASRKRREVQFTLADAGLEILAAPCRQPPRYQDGPCRTVRLCRG